MPFTHHITVIVPDAWANKMSSLLLLRSNRECLIEIKINHNFDSDVYTSGSAISGCVLVTPQKDTPFDGFRMLFPGTASTRVVFPQHSVSPNSHHKFLHLRIPIWNGHLPEPRTFKAGCSYSVPFAFIVPSQLDAVDCARPSTTELQDQHLRLPPTMGSWDGDDHSPEMTRIEYTLSAEIHQSDGKTGQGKTIKAFSRFRVLPLHPEDPPLHILPEGERDHTEKYHLIQAKNIRQNLFASKIGNLKAAATQPSPITLSVDTLRTSDSSIKLDLEFEPAFKEAIPPEIHSMTAKLRSITHFSLQHIDYQPDLRTPLPKQLSPAIFYSISNKIPIPHPGRLFWKQRSLSGAYRNSESDYGDPSSESLRAGGCLGAGEGIASISVKHFTTLKVPLSIPILPNVVILPTFHSCIISRTYTVDLLLSVGQFGTALSLAIPLQVIVKGRTSSPTAELPCYANLHPGQAQDDGMPPPYDLAS